MNFLRKWKKKRRLKYIPIDLTLEPLHETLKSFNEEMPILPEISKKEFPKSKGKTITKKVIPEGPKEKICVKKYEYERAVRKPIKYRSSIGGMYDAIFKIVIFGEPGVQKTALTKRFMTDMFIPDTQMTIGVEFEIKTMEVDDQMVKLQIWDFGGEERFRFLLPKYIRGASGGFFVYDVSNKSTLMSLNEWLTIIKKEIRPEDNFPILVIGIIPDILKEREVPAQEAIEIAKARGVDGFVECRVSTGENVEKAFEALTRLMLSIENIIY